ncbi:uncharacterized protein EAF02_009981 [Botrytis sinoallii]|uniref:uncharacterized protein n=1 Tax=Botrytis sinoallii TaxID=1463999 RepID=UPI00190198E3|nr:uncharacterized protein EAF02_009981 [Botrytis sinoallii]KAF7865558.1 hypothetical protein EAF02_009981 [Botrytis sinoallii]
MDRAKSAVSDFLSKDGKHDTTVHEVRVLALQSASQKVLMIYRRTINPAVQNEHVIKTRHEEATTAIDREVHQDHHHTSIQPIQDREVLPEQHSHQLGAVEHRNIKHGDDNQIQERLAAEQAQFKNTRTVGETQHTAAKGATVAGEHVHHHVHETIQPVIEKETVQPSVVHTTIPVHEVHQNEAKHHTATALPAVSMSEFRSQGGSLGGREERTDAFKGEPKSVGGTLGGEGARGTTSLTEGEGIHTGAHTGTGIASTTAGTAHHTTSHSSTESHKKPSLMDKLNPKVDADGDGKAGFMK